VIDSVTGVVLAGGKSSRMGTDKAFVRLEQETLVERCLGVLRSCFNHNMIIANQPEAFVHFELPVFPDDVPDVGPLGGILTALRHAETEWIFVVACDMPFLNADLIREMATLAGQFDAVAPKIGNQFEPLHAVYHRRVLAAVESKIASRDYSVHGLLQSVRVQVLSESDLGRHPQWHTFFQNVNNPADLERVRGEMRSLRRLPDTKRQSGRG